MSGVPLSFQQRTDDLYRLKTRNLIYQNVDGTFPTKGSMGYMANTVGEVGWSPVSTDSAGNMLIPGGVNIAGGAVTVNRITGDFAALYNATIGGNLSANQVTTNAVNLINIVDLSSQSQLYDTNDICGNDVLNWVNRNGQAEPLSGWSPRLTPSSQIFRLVNTDGMTGELLTISQNMNALLTLLQERQCFVGILAPAASSTSVVFNTTVSIIFNIFANGEKHNFSYTVNGDPTVAVSYGKIAADITSAAAAAGSPFKATFNPGATPTFVFSIVGSDPTDNFYYFDNTPTLTNGSAQLFMNHLGFYTLQINTEYARDSPDYPFTADIPTFSNILPTTPTEPPGAIVVEADACVLGLPDVPPSPIEIQQVCIYLRLESDTTFGPYPIAIIDASESYYDVSGLESGTTYFAAISYRSLYDESPLGPAKPFVTMSLPLMPATALPPNTKMFSVHITQDVNWLSTPSYGVATVNHGKQYLTNVKYTVASVFSAIWSATLDDLTNVEQITGITLEFYAGTSGDSGDARFFAGANPNAHIISSESIEPKYGDTAAIGATSLTILADGDGRDMIREIFNAGADGVIDRTKNMVFGWYSSRGGGIRNCEMTGFQVVYTVA